MTPRTALLLLALAGSVGCTRYNSRGQAPQTRLPPPPPEGVVPPRSPLAMAAPTKPAPALPYPDTGTPVPPAPPGAAAAGLLPPSPPTPPAVAANPPGRRSPPTLPSPYAQPAVRPQPAAPPSPTQPVEAAATDDVRRVLTTAATRWQSVPSYDALLTRREFITEKTPVTSEQVQLQFRKEPFAIYMLNVGETGKGRQVLYVKGQYEDRIQIRTGAGDRGLWVGMAVTMSPDDSMVKERSRYSIRDAGFGNSIARLAAAAQARPDAVKYAGKVQRPEYQTPLDRIDQTIAPRGEPLMPNGGSRYWFFDAQPDSPSYGLPVLMIATDPSGKELEYYCHTAVRVPSAASAADFTPDRLSRKK